MCLRACVSARGERRGAIVWAAHGARASRASQDDEAIWEDWRVDCQRRMPAESALGQIARKAVAEADRHAQLAEAARARALSAKAAFKVAGMQVIDPPFVLAHAISSAMQCHEGLRASGVVVAKVAAVSRLAPKRRPKERGSRRSYSRPWDQTEGGDKGAVGGGWTSGVWTSAAAVGPPAEAALAEAREVMRLATGQLLEAESVRGGKAGRGKAGRGKAGVWLSALELQTGLAGTVVYGRLACWLLAREPGRFRRFANSPSRQLRRPRAPLLCTTPPARHRSMAPIGPAPTGHLILTIGPSCPCSAGQPAATCARPAAAGRGDRSVARRRAARVRAAAAAARRPDLAGVGDGGRWLRQLQPEGRPGLAA